jgi:4-amino-4-deoxy-L-arabinose transferase-like glycosyltransferase
MTTQLTTTSPAAEPERPARGRFKRLVLGAPTDPRWARPALWAILVLAAILYSWDLSRNGDANAFYAAAVLSGTESWKAFFYGSLDSASFITVDKPPFAFWVMGISARIFGFNSWSLLLPQAAEGVAAVAVVYAAVRRSVASLTGERGAHVAALIAALALTLTPMVVAIDRDNNPDTMLTLLLALGAWGLLESLRAGRGGAAGDGREGRAGTGHPVLWLMVSAVAFGLAFNTKMLEGFIALPALPVVYLIASKARLRTRLGRLAATGGVLGVITLAWMTIVDLIPKTSRPYVGSSTNDTVWNLAVGYNGFGRITGGGAGGIGGVRGTGPTRSAAAAGGAVPAGAGGGGFSDVAHRAGAGGAGGFGGFGGQAGIGRLFASTLGGQISWLIPFAVIALIGTLILIGRRPRIDLARASVLLWGGWFVLEFVVLSFQQGTQHPYYVSAMAPPIAALTGIGVVAFYQAYRRSSWWSLVLPIAIATTGGWAFVLLRRTPGWNPWLAWTVAGATIVTVLALAYGWLRGRRSADGPSAGEAGQGTAAGGRRRFLAAGRRRPLIVVAAVAGLFAVLAGPAAYAVTPLSKTIEGSNPTAGPTAGGGGFAGFGGGPGGARGGLTGFGGTGAAARADGGAGGSGTGGSGGGRTGTRGNATGRAGSGTGQAGTDGRVGAGRAGGVGGFGGAGGLGGTASKQMIAYLEAHRDGATWLVAVQGSSAAASIILATGGVPVMAMGGFRGTDPAPTVAQFQQYVKEGKIHYVMTGGRGGFGGGAGGGGTVTSWVEQNCTPVPASAYGGTTAASSSAASAGTGTVAAGLYHCG